MRLLLIFVGLFYVTFFSVAQGSVLTYAQPNIDQIISMSAVDCKNHSFKNLAVSQCSLIIFSATEDTDKSSLSGEDITKLCLVHAITLESSGCIEPAAQKQIPILTIRLVALQPFSIKKPPRMTS